MNLYSIILLFSSNLSVTDDHQVYFPKMLTIRKKRATINSKVEIIKFKYWHFETVFICQKNPKTIKKPNNPVLVHVLTWQQILASLKWLKIGIQFSMTDLLGFQLLGQQAWSAMDWITSISLISTSGANQTRLLFTCLHKDWVSSIIN